MNTGISSDHPEMERVLQNFLPPAPPTGYLAEGLAIIRGLAGTFLTPYTAVGGQIAGDRNHRADIISPYHSNVSGLNLKISEETRHIADLRSKLDQIQDASQRDEMLQTEQKFLERQEALQVALRELSALKAGVLTRMRGYFGDDSQALKSNEKLIAEIEELHQRVVADFDKADAHLSAIRERVGENQIQQWLHYAPLQEVEPTKTRLESQMELAKYPWKRKGALAFVKSHLGLGGVDPKAVEAALKGINGAFGQASLQDLKAGDLQQLIIAMEKTIKEGKDSDGKYAQALVALKGLVATAALENPDEVRRLLSLATFLFVSSMTGGVGGLVLGSAAKTFTDYFLLNFLPAKDSKKPETTFSKLLRVVEAAVTCGAGGLPAMGAYAATELAHHLVPNSVKPALVFGAAYLGSGLSVPAAAGATFAAKFPHTSLETAGKAAMLLRFIKKPWKIFGEIGSGIKYLTGRIQEAARQGRWGEVILRVMAIVLPILVIIAIVASPFLPFLASTVASTAFTGALVLTAIGAAFAVYKVVRMHERHKKQEMVSMLEKWKSDYEKQLKTPEERDAGVLKVFEAMQERVKKGKKLTRQKFLELLKTHVPALKDYTNEQLDSVMTKLHQQ